MKQSLPFNRRRLSLLLLLGWGLAFFLVSRGMGQSSSQDQKSTPSTSPTTAQTEAQKKAAERKKRFEEQKALLDGGGSATPGAAKHAPATDTEFWIDPIGLNMLPNETQEIHVWDWRGNDVSARVSWGMSGNGIVDMTVKHHAIVTAKMPGTVSVTGTVDGHTVEAIVTVYRGEKLPPGTPPTVLARPALNHGGRHSVSTVTVSPN